MKPIWIIVIILLVLALFGVPDLGWHHNYGYGPSGLVVVLVIILVVLALTGRL